MNNNAFLRALGLAGLCALLALGLAACGGDEPAPVVQPPAPPPAPPPFQPQPVEVALGGSSDTITLMTAEDGGFTLNGESFASGSAVAADNGNRYLLTLDGGQWTAAYQAAATEVPLGITGETVTLTVAEDGSYLLGDAAFEAGGEVMSENGNTYALTMDEAGMWVAAYVASTLDVALGTSGETVMLTRAEDGSYWIGDMTLESGAVVMSSNDSSYALAMDESGTWVAAYVASTLDVALGESGESVTLTKAEDGAYWIGDMTFEAGGEVMSENGNTYALTMDEAGMWVATYVAATLDVALGASGETVMLTRAEDGAYWMGDMAVESGAVVMSTNGSSYALAMDESGWTATYQAATQTVALGASGLELTVSQAEDGSWVIDANGFPLVSGMTYDLPNGNSYLAMQDENGMWTASFVPAETAVALGTSGSTLVLASTEAGGFTRNGEDFASGTEVTAENGSAYALTLDATGAWMAAFVPMVQTVALGTSGTLDLESTEDGGWTRAGEAFAGGSHVADNGNVYTLTLAGGVWSSAYVPDTMAISGTGLTATSREDGSGYDVTSDMYDGTASLGTDGAGDVMLGGAMFHVNMDEDGNLEGARFAVPIESRALYENVEGTSGRPSLSGDDRSTPDVNEAGVTLTAAGSDFSAGALLSSGAADAQGGTFVAAALADMIKLRNQVAVLVDLFNDGGLDRSTLTAQLLIKWTEATAAVNKVFADAHTLDEDTNPRRVVAAFDELVDALSSEEAFIAATAADSDNVFDAAERTAAQAAADYARVEWEASAVLGQLGDTRFGAAVRGNRNHAEQGAATAKEQTQAFAYATIESTRRASDVQVSGNAYYQGRTHAVDNANTPNLYVGDMELQVRFTRSSVSGLVSNLETVDGGEPWSHGLGGAVERIFLPDATLRRTGSWTGSGEVRLKYAASAGGAVDLDEDGGEFDGRLLGRGDEAGEQAIGTWSVVGDDSVTLLAGGFGAQRVADRADPIEAVIDNVQDREATALVPEGFTDLDEENLRIMTFPADKTAGATSAAELSADGSDAETVEVKLSLETLFGDGYDAPVDDQDSRWAQQTVLVGNHRETALEELTRLRSTLQKWVAFDDADASDADVLLANQQRLKVIADATAVIDDELFGKAERDDPDDPTMLLPGETVRVDPAEWVNRIIVGSPGQQILAESEAGYPGLTAETGTVAEPDSVTEFSGRPQDAAVLARLDAVIEALSDPNAFADAFESGGVFAGAYSFKPEPTLDVSNVIIKEDPYEDATVGLAQGLTPDQIWNKARVRVGVWTETTDFTRFGVWHGYYSRYASDDTLKDPDTAYNQEGSYYVLTSDTGTGANKLEVYEGFAFSPLDTTDYSGAAEADFPTGATMTFVGSTVAAVRGNMYTGGVEARVRWAANMDNVDNVGKVTLTLTDLTSTIPAFGLIRHGWHPDSNPANTQYADRARGDGWEEVRAITFPTADIKSDMTFCNCVSGRAKLTRNPRALTLEYNTFDGKLTQKITRAHPATPAGTPKGWIQGSFVGQDADGPLGLIGTWEIKGSTGDDTFLGINQAADANFAEHLLSTGNSGGRWPLHGAFGADIAP